MKSKNLFVAGNSLLAVIFFVCSISGCQRVETYEKPLALVGVHSITLHTPAEGIRYSAVIRPATQVELAFRVGGYVSHIYKFRGADRTIRPIEAGDSVKKGAVLARIRQADYAARVRQCQAAIAESRAAETPSRHKTARCMLCA